MMLREIKADLPERFEHVLQHYSMYCKNINNIYRLYWEYEKSVPSWFGDKYKPLYIPPSEFEIELHQKHKDAIAEMKQK